MSWIHQNLKKSANTNSNTNCRQGERDATLQCSWRHDETLGYGLDDRGFESRQRLGIFLFTTTSRPALRSTHPPLHWVPGALSLGLKRLGREADHSLPSSADIKEYVELYLHSPNTPAWRGAQLSHRDLKKRDSQMKGKGKVVPVLN
jgi:hypothetical protein